MRVSDEEGAGLVRRARLAASGRAPAGGPSPDAGAFVTIRRGGALRGCIGYVMPDQPLHEAVDGAAAAAAAQDPRFEPIGRDELDLVTFEVTVLSPPEPMQGPREGWPAAIRIGTDGILVEGMGGSGLLLPQVAAEQGWDAAELLAQTCLKAGLGRDCWQDGRVQVSSFTGQAFAEESPGGQVRRAL